MWKFQHYERMERELLHTIHFVCVSLLQSVWLIKDHCPINRITGQRSAAIVPRAIIIITVDKHELDLYSIRNEYTFIYLMEAALFCMFCQRYSEYRPLRVRASWNQL